MDDLKTKEQGWTPVELAYSLWLRTARETAGSAVALVRTIKNHLTRAGALEYVSSKWASDFTLMKDADWAGKTIKRWESGDNTRPQPQQTRDETLRNALIEAVITLIPEPPSSMPWSTFREVSDAFNNERMEREQRGGLDSESRVVRERNAERHNFLAIAPTPAKLIDPIALGLGSWAFDNALPPYVTRTTDQALSTRLNTTGVTTVSGAPKSGKSRSILEVLQQDHPEALTWWVNPSPTVLPLVVQGAIKAPKAGEKPAFIILDDASLIGTNPEQGITAQRINELSQNCTHLILVIHDETLASWEHHLSNRIPSEFDDQGLGATHELMELLKHRIHYDSVLDETEIPKTSTAFNQAHERVKSFDLTRIAETFAGVKTLLDKASKALETPTSMEAALIEAAIDASICFPSGTTPEILGLLTATHYRNRQPNRPWRPHLLDEAFDALTTGITTGSPHSILTTTNHKSYRLMDALVPELQHPNRNILQTLHTSQLDENTLSRALFDTGFWFHQNNHNDQAHQAWTTAANLGNIAARHNLGFLAAQTGNIQEALEHYERAANVVYAKSMADLGNILAEAGDFNDEFEWWEPAPPEQTWYHMHQLGQDAQKAGNTAAAIAWWKRAGEKGDTQSMLQLGLVADAGGDVMEARKWWVQASEKGDVESTYAVGVLAFKAGDNPEARTWWERAAKLGSGSAMFGLGMLAEDSGEVDQAQIWFDRSKESGDAAVFYGLGQRAKKAGDFKAAREFWEPAAESGHLEARLKLGIVLYEEGDVAGARRWWELAAEKGNAEALMNLGILADEADNSAERRMFWERAANAGHSRAMLSLGHRAMEAGAKNEAFDWWERAAEHGHADAMEELAKLAEENGDHEAAARWYARAAETSK